MRGFTLIELMIALSLIALMVSLLFGGIRLGNRTWERVDETTTRSSEMRQIWQFLESRFRQARVEYEITEEAEQEERLLVFFGTSNAVEFVTPFPDVGFGGLNVVRLEESRDGDESRILLTRWLYHTDVLEGGAGIPSWRSLKQGGVTPRSGVDDSVRAFVSQSVLVEGLESIEIEYFGVGEEEEEAKWVDRWDAEALPEMVAISIVDDKGAWPEMKFVLPSQ